MQVETLADVVVSLGLATFDLLLLADGSGTKLERPCGWACYAYTPGGPIVEHLGGTSGGTNNFAELAPFLHALWSFHTRHFQGEERPRGVRVELVSDSEVTVRCGNGQYGRHANLPLWASIDWFVANGYLLHWNHIPRNSNSVATMADRRGREVRRVLESYVLNDTTS